MTIEDFLSRHETADDAVAQVNRGSVGSLAQPYSPVYLSTLRRQVAAWLERIDAEIGDRLSELFPGELQWQVESLQNRVTEAERQIDELRDQLSELIPEQR